MSNCIRGGDGIKLIIIKLYSSTRYSVFRARCACGCAVQCTCAACRMGNSRLVGGRELRKNSEKRLQSFGVKYLTGSGKK